MGIFSDQPGARRPSRRLLHTVLLTALLLFIIVGLVLPALNMRAEHYHNRDTCANHQRQIINSMMVYANDNDQLWPCRPTDAHGNPTTNPAAIDGFCTAAASLELLMVRNTDLPLKIFVCPDNPGTAKYLTSPTANGMTYGHGVSQWGNNHLPETPGGPGGMAFAYDWSSPINSVIRILTADRSATTHRNVILCAAVDGHIVCINRDPKDRTAPVPGSQVTMDLSGNPETLSFPSKDSAATSAADDVYDDHGDDGDMNAPALGSATRCWVR